MVVIADGKLSTMRDGDWEIRARLKDLPWAGFRHAGDLPLLGAKLAL
jgi:hypothetical protein